MRWLALCFWALILCPLWGIEALRITGDSNMIWMVAVSPVLGVAGGLAARVRWWSLAVEVVALLPNVAVVALLVWGLSKPFPMD